MKEYLIWIILLIAEITIGYNLMTGIVEKVEHDVKIDTIEVVKEIYIDTLSLLTDPQLHLYDALVYHKVNHPEIVCAQAILETGWFTSNLFHNNNNLFGLYNSKSKQFFKFNNWHDSIKGYKNMIQYKYKEGEDYYAFLTRIGYAEDPKYINKLKVLVNKLNF